MLSEQELTTADKCLSNPQVILLSSDFENL